MFYDACAKLTELAPHPTCLMRSCAVLSFWERMDLATLASLYTNWSRGQQPHQTSPPWARRLAKNLHNRTPGPTRGWIVGSRRLTSI